LRTWPSYSLESCRTRTRARISTDFPHLKRWLETIGARPATLRAYAKAKEVNPEFRASPAIRTEEERQAVVRADRRGGEVTRKAVLVMAGHSRPKDGVASARLCPAIHAF